MVNLHCPPNPIFGKSLVFNFPFWHQFHISLVNHDAWEISQGLFLQFHLTHCARMGPRTKKALGHGWNRCFRPRSRLVRNRRRTVWYDSYLQTVLFGTSQIRSRVFFFWGDHAPLLCGLELVIFPNVTRYLRDLRQLPSFANLKPSGLGVVS